MFGAMLVAGASIPGCVIGNGLVSDGVSPIASVHELCGAPIVFAEKAPRAGVGGAICGTQAAPIPQARGGAAGNRL